jgi:hypothetical protein
MNIPNMELMTATQGFASTRSGLRTRSLGKGGSFGAAEVVAAVRASCAGDPLPATMLADIQMSKNSEGVDGSESESRD